MKNKTNLYIVENTSKSMRGQTKLFLSIFFMMFFLGLASVSAVDISTCQTLSSDTSYTLTANITSSPNLDCLEIPSSSVNITIDCNDYWIIGVHCNTSIKW